MEIPKFPFLRSKLSPFEQSYPDRISTPEDIKDERSIMLTEAYDRALDRAIARFTLISILSFGFAGLGTFGADLQNRYDQAEKRVNSLKPAELDARRALRINERLRRIGS